MSVLGTIGDWITKNLGSIFSGSLQAGASAYDAYSRNQGQREANIANRDIAGMTNLTNMQIAQGTNIANAQQLQHTLDWQERMSNTAYQRSMADMKMAGINPMLAASLGGSSTPPGASIPQQIGAPQQTGAPMQNTRAGGTGLTAGMSGAMDVLRLQSELKNQHEMNAKIKSDTALNKALKATAEQNAILTSNSARNARLAGDKLSVELPVHQWTAGVQASLPGKVFSLAERLLPGAAAAKSLANIVGKMYSKALGLSFGKK